MHISYAATAEQVERYLEISHSEDELISMESAFEMVQNRTSEQDSNTSRYDTELLSVRFRESLQKSLSKNEMDKILNIYDQEIAQKFASANNEADASRLDIYNYIQDLNESGESKARINLVKKISVLFSDKETLSIVYDELIEPVYKRMMPKTFFEENREEKRKSYIEMAQENIRNNMLYKTRDFTLEELEELTKIYNTPAAGYESKALAHAIVYALKDLMESMSDRMGHTRDSR